MKTFIYSFTELVAIQNILIDKTFISIILISFSAIKSCIDEKNQKT